MVILVSMPGKRSAYTSSVVHLSETQWRRIQRDAWYANSHYKPSRNFMKKDVIDNDTLRRDSNFFRAANKNKHDTLGFGSGKFSWADLSVTDDPPLEVENWFGPMHCNDPWHCHALTVAPTTAPTSSLPDDTNLPVSSTHDVTDATPSDNFCDSTYLGSPCWRVTHPGELRTEAREFVPSSGELGSPPLSGSVTVTVNDADGSCNCSVPAYIPNLGGVLPSIESVLLKLDQLHFHFTQLQLSFYGLAVEIGKSRQSHEMSCMQSTSAPGGCDSVDRFSCDKQNATKTDMAVQTCDDGVCDCVERASCGTQTTKIISKWAHGENANVCRRFFRNGSCKFGKECRFKHMEQWTSDVVDDSVQSQVSGSFKDLRIVLAKSSDSVANMSIDGHLTRHIDGLKGELQEIVMERTRVSDSVRDLRADFVTEQTRMSDSVRDLRAKISGDMACLDARTNFAGNSASLSGDGRFVGLAAGATISNISDESIVAPQKVTLSNAGHFARQSAGTYTTEMNDDSNGALREVFTVGEDDLRVPFDWGKHVKVEDWVRDMFGGSEVDPKGEGRYEDGDDFDTCAKLRCHYFSDGYFSSDVESNDGLTSHSCPSVGSCFADTADWQ